MPFLNDEVREWIGLELANLGIEDLAVYALEAGREGDERRVMVATEIGLLDHRYAPFGSSARYRLAMLLYPWQVLRGVELRADTFRLWAMEHRTRWSFKLHHPHFEVATESPELGQALCDLARVCAIMAEPFGVPASRPTAQAVTGRGPAPLPRGRAAPTAAIEVGAQAGRTGEPAPSEPAAAAAPEPVSAASESSDTEADVAASVAESNPGDGGDSSEEPGEEAGEPPSEEDAEREHADERQSG
jgi:hypothetical protein